MVTRFCSKCGARITADSIFCEYCGSKLKTPTFTKRSPSPLARESSERPVFVSSNQVSPSYYSPAYYRSSQRSSSQGMKWILIGAFVILILVIIPIIVLGIIFVPFSFNRMVNDYDYIGEKTFSADGPVNATNLELEVYNSVGSVDVEITNLSRLFEARILVYAREGHDLRNANSFEGTQYEDLQNVRFNSNSESYQENPYYYELEVTISNKIATALDIEVSTGSISVMAYETNISNLSLVTSTGSITVDFQEVFINTSNALSIHTSTGSITSTFNNVNYSSSEVEWYIHTSTGSIDLDIFQKTVINDTQINYYVDTSTGSIDFFHELDPLIGLLFDADVSTGTIYAYDKSIDDHYTFKSQNYDSISMKFYLSMDTSTGSIHIFSSL